MSLVKIYEEYNIVNEEYLNLANKLALEGLDNFNNETLDRLNVYKEKFGNLMERINEEDLSAEDENNIKDLKYLVLDGIFLASDLAGFYSINEKERFKMRLANYINKMRRANNM